MQKYSVYCHIYDKKSNKQQKKAFFCMKNNSCSKYSNINNFVLILLMELLIFDWLLVL